MGVPAIEMAVALFAVNTRGVPLGMMPTAATNTDEELVQPLTAVTGTGVAYVDTIKLLALALIAYSGVVPKADAVAGHFPQLPVLVMLVAPGTVNTTG